MERSLGTGLFNELLAMDKGLSPLSETSENLELELFTVLAC